MLSHTGALVGERRAVRAHVAGERGRDGRRPRAHDRRRAGPARWRAHRAGRRLAIITTSGGAGGLAADWCARCGLQVSALAPATRGHDRRAAPGLCVERQPDRRHRDVRQARPEPHGRAVRRRVARPDVDHVLLVLTNTVGEAARQLARSIADARTADGRAAERRVPRGGRPHGRRVRDHDRRRAAGLPRCRGRAARHRRRSRCPPGQPATGRAHPTRRRPHAPFTVMSEADGRALLEQVGVACPASILVDSAARSEAGGCSRSAEPVVLKVQSPDVLHKSDVGAVALGVQPDDAQAAYDTITSRVRRPRPSGRDPGRARPGAGRRRGRVARRRAGSAMAATAPVLTVGIGGTAVEIYGDIANALAPVTPDQALELLRSLRGWPLLDRVPRRCAASTSNAAARAISAISTARRSLRRHARRSRSESAHRARPRCARTVDFVCRLRHGAR